MKTFLKNNYDKIIYILLSFVISIILSLIFFYTTPGFPIINYAATGLIGSFLAGIFYEVIRFIKTLSFVIKNIIYWIIGGIISMLILILI